MKCLVLTSEYPPSKGGVGNAAAAFSREMASRGWAIAIATVAVSGQPEEEVYREGTVHRLALSGTANFWHPLSGDIARFKSLLKNFRPDVAVIHGWQGWCVEAMPMLQQAEVPVILQSHGFGMHYIPWNARPPFGLKIWAGYLPFILHLPQFIRSLHALSVLGNKPEFLNGFDHWIAVKSGCQNVITIPNGVEEVQGSSEPFYESCPSAIGKRLILNVANYCDRKNQLLTLEVARQPNMVENFFVFIGSEENDYSRMLRSKALSWGLKNRVAIITDVPRDITESAVMACDIALMTSKWEMQPLFLLEAMSAGKPWVSSEVGSVRELRGGIVTSLKASDLGTSISSLLEDSLRRKQLGSDGHAQWLVEFSPSVVYDRWQKLLISATAPEN
jgi:glycosyltransferase involved in cell wall biosynthesis